MSRNRNRNVRQDVSLFTLFFPPYSLPSLCTLHCCCGDCFNGVNAPNDKEIAMFNARAEDTSAKNAAPSAGIPCPVSQHRMLTYTGSSRTGTVCRCGACSTEFDHQASPASLLVPPEFLCLDVEFSSCQTLSYRHSC
jgi:hypothetical protein